MLNSKDQAFLVRLCVSAFVLIVVCAFVGYEAFGSILSPSLYWTPPTSAIDGSALVTPLTYNVYQGPKGAAVKSRVGTGLAWTPWSIASVVAGPCFEVTAVDHAGVEGIHSPEVCLSSVPGVPTGVYIK